MYLRLNRKRHKTRKEGALSLSPVPPATFWYVLFDSVPFIETLSKLSRLQSKQLAPRVAPNDAVIVKPVVNLKRLYRSLRIAAVDTVSTA